MAQNKEEWDINKILFIVHLSILVIGIFSLIGVGIYASITFDQREEIGIVIEKGEDKRGELRVVLKIDSIVESVNVEKELFGQLNKGDSIRVIKTTKGFCIFYEIKVTIVPNRG